MKNYRKISKVCPRCKGCGKVEEIPEGLSRQWRATRRAKDITLAMMAQRLGVSAAFVSAIERGKKKWPALFEYRYLQALRYD